VPPCLREIIKLRIKRTLPPAATPIYLKEIIYGLKGLVKGEDELKRFEKELKQHYKVKHCFLVSSGKAALTIILKSLHELQPEKDEVLIPSYTCYSVPSAIMKAGLKVKLCDIDPKTLDYDFNQLKELSDSLKLKKSSLLAIIPTHLFGLPSDIERSRQLFDKNTFVIEDAAQAMGGTLNGQKLGTLGDVGFFSLARGKALSTVEGGIILTNNDKIGKPIKKQMSNVSNYSLLEICKLIIFSFVINIFMRPKLFWFPKSLPFLKLGETLFESDFKIKKMSPFQAGLTKNWQKKLNELTYTRKKNTINWQKLLNSKFKTKNLKLPLLRYPILIKDEKKRNQILSQSEQQGLGIMRGYPKSINNIKELIPQFKIKNLKQKIKQGELIAMHLITLPVHNYMSKTDTEKINNLISKNEIYTSI
jgi:dTDP-4-amino-4,6-dideoxygalactose transaminase